MAIDKTTLSDHLPVIRPLVVSTRFETGESLIGGIARATRANVLRHLDVVLDEVGLSLLHPGKVGQEIGELAPRLAQKLGCEVSEVIERMHPYIDDIDPSAHSGGNGCKPVEWGSGILLRKQLDLKIRHVSPRALNAAPHHRAEWMCNLLPFCTETLDLLVHACKTCGATLGWRNSWGIGSCENCRADVAPSDQPPLDEEHALGYRRFAALVSSVTPERAVAVAALPEELRGLSPISLIGLITGLGHALSPEYDAAACTAVNPSPEARLASEAARGADLLAGWPRRLREKVSERLDARRTDPRFRRDLSRSLRRLGDPATAPSDQAGVIRRALPEAFETLSRAFALTGPVMLASDIASKASINIDQVRLLEKGDALKGVQTRKGERLHRQYAEDDAMRFIEQWNGSESCTRLEQRLGIPRYAVEQLACLGEVHQETGIGPALLDTTLRLASRSVDELLTDLDNRAREEPSPIDAVPLGSVTRTTGGRLKPWGELLGQLRSGIIPCWSNPAVDGGEARGYRWVRHVSVRPDDVEATMLKAFEAAKYPEFPFACDVSQVDACEILNCASYHMKDVAKARDLEFRRGRQGLNRGLWTSLDSVCELARKTIATPEMTLLLGIPTHPLVKMMSHRDDIEKASVGWLRKDVKRAFADLLRAAAARPWIGRGYTAHGVMTKEHAQIVFLALGARSDCFRKVV